MDIADTPVTVPGLTPEQVKIILTHLRDIFCVCTGASIEDSMERAMAIVRKQLPHITESAMFVQIWTIAAQQIVAMTKTMSDSVLQTINDPSQMASIVKKLQTTNIS